MNRENAAGRRSVRRLTVTLLALAVGAMLGASAPQTLAGPRDSIVRYQPVLTLKVSPTSLRPNKIIWLTGDVHPIEIVGGYVTVSVQRRAPSGKWKKVSSAKRQVRFTAPTFWTGPFNIEIAFPESASTTLWQGQARYERTYTDLDFHYADYTMTSATGVCTATGIGGVGLREFSLSYHSETSLWDAGTLRWYFADSTGTPGKLGGIAGDSYEGSASHNVIGLQTITWDDGTVDEYPDTEVYLSAEIWPYSDPTGDPRPVLDPDLQMLGSRVRSLNGYTESVDWNLHQSMPDLPILSERTGTYAWKYTPKKKGLYRLRATIPKTADHLARQTPWRKVTVR